MMGKLWTKVGGVLVGGFLLGSGLILAVQPVQAQSAPTAPSCRIPSSVTDGSTTTEPNLEEAATTIDVDTLATAITLSSNISEEREVDYFQITIPDLVVGELGVTASGAVGRTVASLCRSGRAVATHPNMGTGPAPDDEAHAMIAMQKVTPGTYYIVVRGQDVDANGVKIPSGTAHPTGDYQLAVTFSGVYPTTAGASATGSLSSRGELDPHPLTTNSVGLLTVKTTGSTDTKGIFTGSGDMTVTAEAGGSRGNFQIIAPVTVGDKTVSVQGQSPTTTGDYTLAVDFEVAETLSLTTLGVTDSDGNDIKSGEADYFFFNVSSGELGFMTIQTRKHSSITAAGSGTRTKGTLYGPKGLITTDDNSGDGGNFRLSASVAEGNYIVKVEGQSAGPYTLEITTPTTTDLEPGTNTETAVDVTPAGTSGTLHVAHHQIAVSTAGTLQVLTTGNVDTVGTLYGPDGREIVTDEDSGKDKNFKITQYLDMPGNYIVVVSAADRTTGGSYTLQTGFIEGETVDPTDPTDPTTCPTDPTDPGPIQTDPHGFLENPSGDGHRSGIGVISGWVCMAEEVEVRISSARGVLRETLQVAYGTSRPDTVGSCSHRSPNTGFGMTYNFNHLAEGDYRIAAYADGQQIGETETFEVVHIVREFPNRNNFLELDDEAQDRGICIVPDFPVTGERTWLKWEESTQNFVIEDQG